MTGKWQSWTSLAQSQTDSHSAQPLKITFTTHLSYTLDLNQEKEEETATHRLGICFKTSTEDVVCYIVHSS